MRFETRPHARHSLASSCLLVCLLAYLFVATVSAASEAPLFSGFDRAHLPPAPRGAKVVARVFDRYLTLDSLGGRDATPDERSETLELLVWRQLTESYVQDQGLVVRDAEVERCAAVLAERAQSPLTDEVRLFARGLVLQWLLNRSLHHRYGGLVVYQQLDPLEPVGAYRAFMKEMEDRGILFIRDANLRSRFWSRFEPESFFAVPPERVDFEVPWWTQQQGVVTAPRAESSPPAGSSVTLVTMGHEIVNGTVRFLFDPTRFESVTHGLTGDWQAMREIRVFTVHVAGDFNGWSRGAWSMRPVGPSGSLYLLERPLSDLGAHGDHSYKFVVNGVWWVEPPTGAANRVSTGFANDSRNLVIHVP